MALGGGKQLEHPIAPRTICLNSSVTSDQVKALASSATDRTATVRRRAGGMVCRSTGGLLRTILKVKLIVLKIYIHVFYT